MKTSSEDIDPRVSALPDEGKIEYCRWSEAYLKLTNTYLANVDVLKEIKELDPTRADIYDREIGKLLNNASRNMEEWEKRRQEILEKWLPKC